MTQLATSDYRQKLVRMVEECGKYISENADQMIDSLEWKTDLTIWIRFNDMEVPKIEIQQEHAVVSCLKNWRETDG